ncbi:MAG: sulfotransferase [Fulvivirga sp.]
MIDISGIQVIGTQRSGTNLLRLILNQFKEICAPHPPHILNTFIPILSHYGDLNNEANFKQLIGDVCKWIEFNPVPWNLTLDVNEVFNSCKQRNIYEIFRVVYELKTISEGAAVWCCKSTFNVHYFDTLEAHNIRPFYIHLYRDGRDVALSFQKAIVGPKHVYHIAKDWLNDQVAVEHVRQSVGHDRFMTIAYEDLIHSPKKVVLNICDRLDLKFNEDLLHYYDSKESNMTANAGEMWENVKRPIIHNNSDKYLVQMPSEEIEIFEKVAGDMLQKLNYKLQNHSISGADNFSSIDIDKFDKLNEVLIKKNKSSARAEDLQVQKDRNDLLKSFISTTVV